MSTQKKPKETFTLSVCAHFSLAELVDELRDAIPTSSLVELIKRLDADREDWSLTLELCDHFAKLKVEHDKEMAMDLDYEARRAFCQAEIATDAANDDLQYEAHDFYDHDDRTTELAEPNELGEL